MTYSLSVSGSMTDLNDEAAIEAHARELVSSLDGVSYASLTTTHGGSVNLLETATASAVEEVAVEPTGEAETTDEATE